MKNFAFAFLLFFHSVFAQEKKLPSPTLVKVAMDEVMAKSDLPAVVAIAINTKGERVTYTFGKAIWSEQAEVTTQHIFRIFSMTKLVTSIAAMQLVEKGKINLDDDLSALLPEMAKIPILSNGKLITPKNPITLRHLLTHTSGFGYTGTDKELSMFDRSKWEFKDLPRRFESGTKFLYGTSTDWVGRLVEKLSGTNLENYFRQNITGPLHMNHTSFDVPDSLKPLIVSYGRRGDDGLQPLKESPNRVPAKLVTEYSGGGGLFSSPDDYTILLQCMLNFGEWKGAKILKRKTVEEINQNQISSISMENSGAYFNPATCCNLNGLATTKTKWGLAALIDNDHKPYGRKAGTILWGGLLNTYFFIDYKSGIASSIYTQHLPFNHPATTSLYERFSELIYSSH